MGKAFKYYMFHKPKGVLSQFTKEHGKKSLMDLISVPGDVYPIGRLDEDSEGLLLLSNNKSVNSLLLDPSNRHWRTYFVQVTGQITNKALKKLEKGIDIAVKGLIHSTLPAKAKKTKKPGYISNQSVSEKNTTWIKLSLQEGKYHQVRKMTAKVGFPTLRLIRTQIEDLELGNLKEGELKQIDKVMFAKKLYLEL